MTFAESRECVQSEGSTDSFAFPVLDWEGIGTPAQMPKPDGQHHLKKQKDTAAFPNFVKKSLHVDLISEQLKQKVYSLNGSAKKELVTKRKSGKVESDVDNSSLALSGMVRFDNFVGLAEPNKDDAKKGLELMGESKRVVLGDRSRNFSIFSC
ncbi:hypothetical protein MTR_4g109910 [Medicago truncatula]|uniref:Uncharacterized protein n=1 Tax=Medicago truncatula TaxID=3880 RepID=A0A072UQU4_MEDTR|nr:hypothetical protein MTR_4g109910 [Medicago truncatula]